jgi:adenylate cyclase class 2
MIEVEVKASAPADIVRRIIDLGGIPQAVENHQDLYFNSPVRDFKRSDEALRIRIKEGGARLTYKGPKLDSTTKSRLELTARIDDMPQMQEILQALGFVLSAQVKKRRSKYRYQDVTIAVDEVDDLGCYVEVEGQGTGDYEQVRQKVVYVMRQLGLTQSIRSSYLELLEQKRMGLTVAKREQI